MALSRRVGHLESSMRLLSKGSSNSVSLGCFS